MNKLLTITVDKILTIKKLSRVVVLLLFRAGIWFSNMNAGNKAEKRGQITDNEKG